MLGSFGASLCRCLRLVNSQLLVAEARFGGGTRRSGRAKDLEMRTRPRRGRRRRSRRAPPRSISRRACRRCGRGRCRPPPGRGCGSSPGGCNADSGRSSPFLSFASSAKAWLGALLLAARTVPAAAPAPGVPPRVKPTSFINRPTASSSRPIEVASAASTGSAPPAERTLRAWLASRSARSMRIQLRPAGGRRARRRVDRPPRKVAAPAAGRGGIGWPCARRARRPAIAAPPA